MPRRFRKGRGHCFFGESASRNGLDADRVVNSRYEKPFLKVPILKHRHPMRF